MREIRLNSNGESEHLMAALTRETLLKQVLFNAIEDSILVIDATGEILEVNSATTRMLGLSPEKLVGADFDQVCHFLHERNRVPVDAPIKNAIAHSTPGRTESFLILIAQNGTECIVKLTAWPLQEAQGAGETVVVIRDVTKNRVLSQQLQWQAGHDSITGLINRIQFEELVARALQCAAHEKRFSVLAQLDIDDFKVINDTCGHIAGDQLLGQIAIIFQDHLRPKDWLARLGGDEFGVLLEDCTLTEAQLLIHELQQDLEKFRYTHNGKTFAVQVSIGLVQLDEDVADVEMALSKADTACYTAKQQGKNRLQVFSIDDVAMGDLKRHQEWHFLIQNAIEEDRFVLYRQPIMAIENHDMFPHHYEVLLRMLNPSGDIIAPDHFVPTAERYNLMRALDRWVVQHSLSNLELALARPDAEIETFAVHSINLSGASLSDEQFMNALTTEVLRCNVPANKICFEITETAAIENLQRVRTFMQVLQSVGCRFSLDDFGAGMSSFGYLNSLPVDFVKIDGQFIQDIVINPANVTIVESIVHVSKSLGLMTIAERVEDQTTAQRLKSIGVDFIQGYGVGKPQPWIANDSP